VPADLPEVRASDADRDRVVDVLREAVGDGRLRADEFDERMEAALSSRTLGELAGLTADLEPGPGGSGANRHAHAGWIPDADDQARHRREC